MSRTIAIICLLLAAVNSQVTQSVDNYESEDEDNVQLLMQSVYSYLSEDQDNLQPESLNAGDNLNVFDFIIVGAGSAGCALANRLTENPSWRVLLIEAGDYETPAMDVPVLVPYLQRNQTIDWSYQTEPSNTSCLAMNDQRCNWARGKVMGGSSVLNFMIYTRGNRRDYDRWAELGADGWSYDQVLPYFKKVENNQIVNADPAYAGYDGPVTVSEDVGKSDVGKAFVAAAQEIGLPYTDYNGPTQIGVSYMQSSKKNGRRASSNMAYIYPIRSRKNLFVRRLTRVTKIVIDSTTKTATGVQYVRNGKRITLHARKEVIVSAGAINSPQLLMLSGIGPKSHLTDMQIKTIVDLPVGYNLMDHAAPAGMTFLTNATTLNADAFFKSPSIATEFQTYSEGANSTLSASITESLAYLDLDDPTDALDGWPDIELLQFAVSWNSCEHFRAMLGISGTFYEAYVQPLIDMQTNAFMIFPLVLRPRSRGRIMLASRDPMVYPLIYANYLADPYDVRVSVNGIKKSIELINTDAFRKIDARLYETPVQDCAHLGFGADAYWECLTRYLTLSIYHFSGTCKMGAANDPTAVVDPRLRVRGVKALRVVDASIFPEIMAGHTNAGVYMVAEKAADMIKEDWANAV